MFSNNINLNYHFFYQFNKSLLNKIYFLKEKKILASGFWKVVYIATNVIF